MNKHSRMAVVIAPFLAIGGYVASGYYLDDQALEARILTLEQEDPCNMLDTPCVLNATGLIFQLSHESGKTTVTTSFNMETLTISFVGTNGTEAAYPLLATDRNKTWSAMTAYDEIHATSGVDTTVRLAATLKNLTYIHEFKPGL